MLLAISQDLPNFYSPIIVTIPTKIYVTYKKGWNGVSEEIHCYCIHCNEFFKNE